METIVNVAVYDSPMGELLVGVSDDAAWLCAWRNSVRLKRVMARISRLGNVKFVDGIRPMTCMLRDELDEYFAGKRSSFSMPIKVCGTDFQKQVWSALAEVPYATTISYSALARRAGCQSSVRAVAAAMGDNSLCLLLPCHRVTGSGGSIGGYAGSVETKLRLLELESSVAKGAVIE